MTVRIRIAGYQDEQSVHTQAVRVMAKALLEKGAGSVSVDFESNITKRGRKAADLLDLVKSGDLDICYFSSSYLATRVPALLALDVPFQFTDQRQTRASLDASLGAALRREVAAHTEYEVLAFWDNGLRNISNCKRPIRGPDDCVGLRIRTLPSPNYLATFRALGMEPVSIDVADMVPAIADGSVDAQENPLTNIQLFGLQKYHPFVTATGHFHGIALVLCNARSLARWPDHVRFALSAAVNEGTAAQWDLASKQEIASRQALELQGIKIVDLDEAARSAFRQTVHAVIERAYSELPQELVHLLGVSSAIRNT
jgi:TRAP-type C4-dicarboxylate transport system substrate-binding protein